MDESEYVSIHDRIRDKALQKSSEIYGHPHTAIKQYESPKQSDLDEIPAPADAQSSEGELIESIDDLGRIKDQISQKKKAASQEEAESQTEATPQEETSSQEPSS